MRKPEDDEKIVNRKNAKKGFVYDDPDIEIKKPLFTINKTEESIIKETKPYVPKIENNSMPTGDSIKDSIFAPIIESKKLIIKTVVPEISDSKAAELAKMPTGELIKAVEEIKQKTTDEGLTNTDQLKPEVKEFIFTQKATENTVLPKTELPEVAKEETKKPKTNIVYPQAKVKTEKSDFDFFVWLYDLFN